jgi:hypothetical protein
MNWIKGKKQRVVIIISIALIVCGFLMIPLSRKADNLPHDGWTNLITLMGMAGGGGIGAVISLHISARRNKQKYSISPDGNTNRLKKKAWKDFGTICVTAIVALVFFGFLTYANAKGVRYLIFGLLPVGVMAALAISGVFKEHKEQYAVVFDERELYLIHRATNIGNGVFMGYATLAIITAFNLIGGRGLIPVWTLPLSLFSGFFLSGTVQFLVLMHHAKEDDKNIEGGAA